MEADFAWEKSSERSDDFLKPDQKPTISLHMDIVLYALNASFWFITFVYVATVITKPYVPKTSFAPEATRNIRIFVANKVQTSSN
jgi:hypothetical protein